MKILLRIAIFCLKILFILDDKVSRWFYGCCSGSFLRLATTSFSLWSCYAAFFVSMPYINSGNFYTHLIITIGLETGKVQSLGWLVKIYSNSVKIGLSITEQLVKTSYLKIWMMEWELSPSIDEIKRSILNYLKVTLIDRYLKKDGQHNSQNIVIWTIKMRALAWT